MCCDIGLQAQTARLVIKVPERRVLVTSSNRLLKVGTVDWGFYTKAADGSEDFATKRNLKVYLNNTPEDIVYLRLTNLRWEHEEIDAELPIQFHTGKFKMAGDDYLTLLENQIKETPFLYPGESTLDLPFQVNRPKQHHLNVEIVIAYSFKGESLEMKFTPTIYGRTDSPEIEAVEEIDTTTTETTTTKPPIEETITTTINSTLPDIAELDTSSFNQELDSTALIVQDIEIDETWKALAKKSILPLRKFVTNYADNEYAIEKGYIKEASEQMALIEETTWTEATKNEYYKKYIRLFPKGKYIKEAKKADAAKREKSDEDITWEGISDSTNPDDYRAYLDLYPDGKYAEEAEEAIKAYAIPTYTVQQYTNDDNDQVYEIQFENVTAPRLLTRTQPRQLEFDQSRLLDGNILKVFVKDGGRYNIAIKDLSGRIDIPLDNALMVTVDSIGSDLVFNVHGGIPPYKIELLKKEDDLAKQQEIFGPTDFSTESVDDGLKIMLPVEKIAERDLHGAYKKIQFTDNTGRSGIILDTYESSGRPIHIEQIHSHNRWIIGSVIGFLIILVFMIYLLRDRKKHKEIEKKYHDYQEEQKDKQKFNDSEDQYPKQISISKRTERSPSDVKIKSSRSNRGGKKKKKSKITIKKRQSVNGVLEMTVFEDLVKKEKFKQLSLAQHWKNSTIKDVFIHENCIMKLSQFLQQENLNHIVEEKEGAIPEIGGFLMGGYTKVKDQERYQVTLNEFIPFVPEYHDLYKIEIGTETLVQELGDAQDKYPEMAVIGWFHTHPGHGLFLSMPDLAVQKHFSKKYQLAMEIDSLTSNLDTAFFTQKDKGKMNNSSDRISKKWFSWLEIKKGMV